MKLKHKVIQSRAREAQGDLAWVEAFAVQIADRANSDMDDGLKGRSYDGDGRQGADTPTQPESWAMRDRDDVTTAQAREFAQALDDARRAARKARDMAGKLVRAEDPGNRNASNAAVLKENRAGVGTCIVCGHYEPGIRENRLVSGRCCACYRYWLRSGKRADRPAAMWSSDESHDAPRDAFADEIREARA